MDNKATIVLVFIVILSAMFISGCAQSGTKATGDVGAAVSEIGSDVSDVSGKLTDTDKILNGK